MGRIAVLSSEPVAIEKLGFDAVTRSISTARMTGAEDRLPDDATGLLIYAPDGSALDHCATDLVSYAVDTGVPLLASASGMHCLNVALSGDLPRPTPSHVNPDADRRLRTSMFLVPGAKTSSTIGGSGWLSINCNHSEGIPQSRLAPGLMASAIADDLTIEAFEMPGHHWVIGVQWDVFNASRMPRGFDGISMAFMERAIGK